jgi:peptidoglycan/xylan/chitin deacetylase (PgdA/CDA1 family)
MIGPMSTPTARDLVGRLFQERGRPVTVFGRALALERNPAVAAAIRESGWDVCSHGWGWIKHYELGEAEEREHIRKAVAWVATHAAPAR